DLDSTGALTYTPDMGFHGVDAFTYKVHDGALYSNTARITIGVGDTAPVAVNDSYTLHGASLTVSAAGVLSNDTDADGDPLTAHLVTGPAYGSLTLNTSGG